MEQTKSAAVLRRKPIFDAVRRLIARSLTQAEVAMLDRAMIKRKPGYEDYVATTSGFIPRPPRR